MATHSQTHHAGRTFFIGRENGQTDKKGRPYFFEYTKNPDPEAKTETRKNVTGGENIYNLYTALDGLLVDVTVDMKDYGGGPERILVIILQDADEKYRIEMGFDSAWGIDFMKRILDPQFSLGQKLRLAPTRTIDRETGKERVFVSAHSGVNALSAKRDDSHLQGIPPATEVVFKGKPSFDFRPVASWLFERVAMLFGVNATANAEFPAAAAINFPQGPSLEDEPLPDIDDLPF